MTALERIRRVSHFNSAFPACRALPRLDSAKGDDSLNSFLASSLSLSLYISLSPSTGAYLLLSVHVLSFWALSVFLSVSLSLSISIAISIVAPNWHLLLAFVLRHF